MEILLANAGDTPEVVNAFLTDNAISLPTLLDVEKSMYNQYPRDDSGFGPFPVNVVVDQDGMIRYLSFQRDLAEVASVMERLLEDNEQ